MPDAESIPAIHRSAVPRACRTAARDRHAGFGPLEPQIIPTNSVNLFLAHCNPPCESASIKDSA